MPNGRGRCSLAQRNLFNVGRALESAGNAIKWGAVGVGAVSGGALGISALTDQVEVALPSALVLGRSIQAYAAGDALSTNR